MSGIVVFWVFSCKLAWYSGFYDVGGLSGFLVGVGFVIGVLTGGEGYHTVLLFYVLVL